jgi:hypothetical protein
MKLVVILTLAILGVALASTSDATLNSIMNEMKETKFGEAVSALV